MAVDFILGEDSFIVTTVEKAVGWCRKYSLWPMPFGTACCAIEMMAALASHYDMARFGAEAMRFSPRQCDMMIVAGTITKKMAPVLKKIYESMSEPKWVIAVGACASSGGIFDTYAVTQGVDTLIPVDVYVPGCPPRPEGLLYAVLQIQEKALNTDFVSKRMASR